MASYPPERDITFEECVYEKDGIEFWFPRELQKMNRAKVSCKNLGTVIADHFADVSKTINMPKGATKEIDYNLF